MWEQYRKTFIPMQLLIVAICLGLYFYMKVPAQAMLPFVVMMELFSVIGARWAVRLRGKVAREKGLLRR